MYYYFKIASWCRRNVGTLSRYSRYFLLVWSFVDDKNSVRQASDIVSSVQALHADLSGLMIRPFIRYYMRNFDLVKIKNRSHKRDGIGVRRIGTFPFRLPPRRLRSAYDLVKTRLSESEEEAEGYWPITMLVPTLCDWFSSSASASDLDNLVFARS